MNLVHCQKQLESSFSIQPDKIRKSEIFTTFEKIHCSFLNNLKSEETKSQIKAHPLESC